MNKITFWLLAFTAFNTSHAIIFSDEEQLNLALSSKPCGVYTLKLINDNNSTIEGTATLFKSSNGTYYGITSAHGFTGFAKDKQLGVMTGKQTFTMGNNTYNFLNIHPAKQWEVSPLYLSSVDWEEKVKQDIAVFSFKAKGKSSEQLHFFEDGFFEEELIPGNIYPVTFTSYGPVFGAELHTYFPGGEKYQEASTSLTYHDKGYFYNRSVSRNFYVALNLQNSGKYSWFCDMLPTTGNIGSVNGDSGGLAFTTDRKALAIQSGRSWEEFYSNNIELATFMKTMKSTFPDQLEAKEIENFIGEIHKIAAIEELTKRLDTLTGKIIYSFTLKQQYPELVLVDYFTPLLVHQPYIQKFVDDNKWDTQPHLLPSKLYEVLNDKLKLLTGKNIKKIDEEIFKLHVSVKALSNKIDEEIQELSKISFTSDKEKSEYINGLSAQTASARSQLEEITIKENYSKKIKELNLLHVEILQWWKDNKNKLKDEDYQLSLHEEVFLEKIKMLYEELLSLNLI